MQTTVCVTWYGATLAVTGTPLAGYRGSSDEPPYPPCFLIDRIENKLGVVALHDEDLFEVEELCLQELYQQAEEAQTNARIEHEIDRRTA